jgi:hypothetical protein
MQRLAIALVAVVLGGCVAQPVYQWGGYEDKLYAGYKDQTKMEELKLDLEKHIANMDASAQKVAPGLFAELGTLYLQSGNAEKAKGLYVRERNAWPESKTLMNALIQNLDRRSQAQATPQEERAK